jgi:drug/metabolite transporter (DMT)-like permease
MLPSVQRNSKSQIREITITGGEYMRVREYLVLFALAAFWGASFLFIRVAVAELSPLTLVGARFIVGTLGFLLVVPFQPARMKGWRRHLWGFFVVAVFNAIIPYLTISWGEQYVPSGMAAILVATIPLATVVISHWWPGGEHITWGRSAGVALGLLGVGIVVGPTTLFTDGSVLYLLGAGSILLGAVSYAFGGLFAYRMLSGLPSVLPALGQTAMGACVLGPIVGVALALHPPTQLPSIATVVSVLALALGGTTLAYICFYWLINHVGPTRTVIVTYLLPCMALVYGALLLHETVSISALGGLVFVLSGVFLVGRSSTQSPAQDHAAKPALEQVKPQERTIS